MSPPAHRALSVLERSTTASTAGSCSHASSTSLRARIISSDRELRVRGRSRVMMPVPLARRVLTKSVMGIGCLINAYFTAGDKKAGQQQNSDGAGQQGRGPRDHRRDLSSCCRELGLGEMF